MDRGVGGERNAVKTLDWVVWKCLHKFQSEVDHMQQESDSNDVRTVEEDCGAHKLQGQVGESGDRGGKGEEG